MRKRGVIFRVGRGRKCWGVKSKTATSGCRDLDTQARDLTIRGM